MSYAVCGMMHINEPLLLFGKSNLCGRSGFLLSLSERERTIIIIIIIIIMDGNILFNEVLNTFYLRLHIISTFYICAY